MINQTLNFILLLCVTGNSIILGPKVISLNGEVLQSSTPSVTSTAVKRTSVISTEIGGVLAKKKPSSGSTNPVILPKTSVVGSVYPLVQKGKIVRNISSVKVVDVEQVVSSKIDKKGKQILIVQNSQGKRGTDNRRQIIRLNPNFELENDASKSTGS